MSQNSTIEWELTRAKLRLQEDSDQAARLDKRGTHTPQSGIFAY